MLVNPGHPRAMRLLPFAAAALNFGSSQDKTQSRDARRDWEDVRRE
jgi:hypothetical protein